MATRRRSSQSAKHLAQQIRTNVPGGTIVAEAIEILDQQVAMLGAEAAASAESTDGDETLLLPPHVVITGSAVAYQPPNDNGGIKVKITINFNVPGPAETFDRVHVYVQQPDAADGTPLTEAGGPIYDAGEFSGFETLTGLSVTFFMNPPNRQEGWRAYVLSGSQYGTHELALHTEALPSPNVYLVIDPIPAGSSGTEWAPSVTGFNATVQYAEDEVGGQMWRVVGTFTPPNDPKYLGVRIVRREGASTDTPIGAEPKQATGYTSRWYPVPNSPTNYTIYAPSIAPNNRTNTIVPGTTPSANITVQRQSGFGLRLNRINTSTFDLGEFDITGAGEGTFQIKVLNADKIQTGTLKVGGGGSKPGQLGVFDAAGLLIGWIGQNGAFYGGWFKQLWVGGTDPTTAPLFVDSSGNVIIDNTGMSARATFTLVRNSTTTKLVNETGPGGLINSLSSESGAFGSYVQPGTIVIVQSGLTRAVMNTTQVLSSDAAGQTVDISGGTGVRVNGNTVINNSRVVNGTGLQTNGVTRIDGSGNITGATGQFTSVQIGGFASISIFNAFVGGGGVDCPLSGIGGAGFNWHNGSFYQFGQSLSSAQFITAIQQDGITGAVDYKFRTLSFGGGILYSVSAESGWTPA